MIQSSQKVKLKILVNKQDGDHLKNLLDNVVMHHPHLSEEQRLTATWLYEISREIRHAGILKL